MGMSREEAVISGVPQGNVLAAILFVIMISDIDENVKMCIIRCFADDTRVNKKIRTNKDKELMREDLDIVYRWAEKNKMKFNEKKFEQMAHGPLKGVTIEPYKTSSGEDIEIKETVKDLGVLATNDLMFKEHINEVITSCKIKQGNILRNFETRKREPMMNLYKSHMRSKAEYCCIVCSPSHKKDISRIEKIQKEYTKR